MSFFFLLHLFLLPTFLPSFNSTRCLAKKNKKNALLRVRMLWKMLVSCTELTSASPSSAYLFFKGTRPAVIILSLPMNGELYMMLQTRSESSATGHIWIIWWPLLERPGLYFSCNSPSTCPTHTPCRKCSAGTGLAYRSVIMYLQGFTNLSYSDTLWVFKGWYAERMWHCGYC